MKNQMNNERIEAVLERQERNLGIDKLFALVVAVGMLICILGLRSASSAKFPTATAQPAPVAAVAVASDLRGVGCMPDAANQC